MVTPIKRRQHSRLAYYLCLLPLWLLLVPLFRLLEWRGKWPRQIFAQRMKHFFTWPQELEPGARDVVVSSYFKSGTNWMLQITTQIAWRGQASFEHIHDLVPWPEMPARMKFAVLANDVDPAASPSGLRVLKTHFVPPQLPFNQQARYIFVIRDPRTVFESTYHFVRNTSAGPLMPSMKNWLDLYLSEDALYGAWPDFTAAAWALRKHSNVLFLTYGQLKRDMPEAVHKIAAFMGVTLTPDEFNSVVEQASFAHMKTIEHKFDPLGVGPPWAKPEGAMIRKGQNKSEQEMLPGSYYRIENWCMKRLQELHCDFPYYEYYGGRRSR